MLTFPEQKIKIYTILVIDYDECCCAEIYTDGEIKVLFSEHSFVDKKMGAGGQSAKRFQRIRQNQITEWFKKINEYIKGIDDEIYLGISDVYKNRFIKTLSTYGKAKIKEQMTIEYSNLSGIYQYVKQLEKR